MESKTIERSNEKNLKDGRKDKKRRKKKGSAWERGKKEEGSGEKIGREGLPKVRTGKRI